MSQAVSEKHRLESGFWNLLRQRYPATALWWHQNPSEGWWPEWSENAFQREMQGWLGLAETAALTSNDIEVLSWGRFARLAVGRLRGEVWKRPAAPLSHAHYGITVLSILADHPRLWHALSNLPSWLDAMRETAAGDYWAQIELTEEALGLVSTLTHLPVPAGIDHVRWTVAIDQAKAAIVRYRDRVKQRSDHNLAIIPWVGSAHVDVWEWHNRRMSFEFEPHLKEPMRDTMVLGLADLLGGLTHTKKTLVPQLHAKSFWRWNDSGPAVIYYGDHAQSARLGNLVLDWWQQKARLLVSLTWAIAEPVWLEAQMLWVMQVFASSSPLAPSAKSWVEKCIKMREALALADAWLWLENGEPDVVARWLEGFVSPGANAWAWVPYLKANPGRALTSMQNYYELMSVHEPLLTTPWSGWQWGPVAPDAIEKIAGAV